VAAPKIGDTPADFGQPIAPAPKHGDTPADHPGASRAPQYDAPTTVEVVRPERTIVRDVDQVQPAPAVGRRAAARARRPRHRGGAHQSRAACQQRPLSRAH
jgi:hypothetical protein